MAQGLYTPSSTAFGQHNSLPILSASTEHTALLPGVALTAAASSAIVALPDETEAVEIEALNVGSTISTLWFAVAQVSDQAPDVYVWLKAHGFRRVIPPGFSVVEFRAAPPGSRLVLYSDNGVDVRVHAHVAS